MKNLKHTFILFVGAFILTSFLTGCEKESSASGKSVEGLLYYYSDEVRKEIKVIDINGPSPFRRTFILSDDVTLEDIALDREDLVLKVYNPSSISPIVDKKGLLIKSKVIENNWLYVANNPFVGLAGTSDNGWWEASLFSNDATGFKFHKAGIIDGEEVFAIESVGYPGRYFTDRGHPIQGANLLYLDEYPEPKDAPKFRLYRPKANFLEGNPHVPQEATLLLGW